MTDMTYPTGWGGEPETMDEFSNNILIVVAAAGKTITYKDAAKQIGEIVKANKEVKND